MLKLQNAVIGAVVTVTDDYMETFTSDIWDYNDYKPRIVGHIVGFDSNSIKEVLIKVSWCNGHAVHNVHPMHIMLYSDYLNSKSGIFDL